MISILFITNCHDYFRCDYAPLWRPKVVTPEFMKPSCRHGLDGDLFSVKTRQRRVYRQTPRAEGDTSDYLGSNIKYQM